MKWIKCEEGYPMLDYSEGQNIVNVLAFDGTKVKEVFYRQKWCEYEDGREFVFAFYYTITQSGEHEEFKATHWMPLPKPPVEE